jgi:hypothetical protein
MAKHGVTNMAKQKFTVEIVVTDDFDENDCPITSRALQQAIISTILLPSCILPEPTPDKVSVNVLSHFADCENCSTQINFADNGDPINGILMGDNSHYLCDSCAEEDFVNSHNV